MAQHTVTREALEPGLNHYVRIAGNSKEQKSIWANYLGYYLVLVNDETCYRDKSLDMAILIYNRR